MKHYSSFDDINRDLKVLELQHKIDIEQLKLDISDAKASLSPVSIIAGMVGSMAKKALILKTVNKLFGFKKVKVKK